MAKSKKDFTLLLIALFCSCLTHAQKQVPSERKDSIDNGSNIILKSATPFPKCYLQKRNGLLIRKTAIKSSRPFHCAYHPLTP